jgi:hypothetical protein
LRRFIRVADAYLMYAEAQMKIVLK